MIFYDGQPWKALSEVGHSCNNSIVAIRGGQGWRGACPSRNHMLWSLADITMMRKICLTINSALQLSLPHLHLFLLKHSWPSPTEDGPMWSISDSLPVLSLGSTTSLENNSTGWSLRGRMEMRRGRDAKLCVDHNSA